MNEQENLEEVQEEIHKAFQVERMVLFSDAVFAIVITLMAIEIKAPEFEPHETSLEITKHLLHLLPNFFAYIISFFFIGITWYRHLRIFSFVKDYDRKLVIANLTLLFFISLFPFSVTMVTQPTINNFLPTVFYFTMVFICMLAQLFLTKYVLLGKHKLRINAPNLKDEILTYRKSKAAVLGMVIMMGICIIVNLIIPVKELKSLAWALMSFTPLIIKLLKKRIK